MAHIYHQVERKNSRIGLITSEWVDDQGDAPTDIGGVGYVPRELSPHLRPLLADHPYIIPYYQTSDESEKIRSLSLVLMVYCLSRDLVDHIAGRLVEDYKLASARTNLVRWKAQSLRDSKYIKPGYAGISLTD